MRILRVQFKNLNSLAGQWKIDLTHPAFISDGIFAITGPTGAGKTTLLDAVCLALYGQTPRLSKVTKSANEIMSRRTGECFAEVTFETRAGRYRCHWSQRRARKKPDGEFQSPRHEMACADSGEIIQSSIRGVAERIESATGMNFDRFTRSMLLAQGDFAAFLQADSNERAPILEQITGTEIYSRISIRVHERWREEQEKLKLLQAETAGIVMLDSAQEKEIEQALEVTQQEEAECTAKSAATRKAIDWLTAIHDLKKEIANLADEKSELYSDRDAFQPDREKLNRALKADSLNGLYATLKATRKQQIDDREALKTEEGALPGLESSAREQAESLRLAEQQTGKTKQDREAAAPVIRRVRSLDQRLVDQMKAVAEEEASCQREAAEIDKNNQARLQERKKRSGAHKTWEQANRYLDEHAQDEWLISGLAGVEEQLHGLLSKQEAIAQKEIGQDNALAALEQAEKSFNNCQQQCGTRRHELEAAAKKLQQGKEALSRLLGDRLLREYRTEQETLLRERAFLTKIAELEDYRAQLEDGKPCPLCGATDHPYAEDNVPNPDETDQRIDALTKLISEAESQESAIKELKQSENAAHKNLMEAEKQESVAVHEKKAAEKALTEAKEGLEKLRADFTEYKQTISAKLLPLGFTTIPETDITSLIESLRARRRAWQDQAKKKADTEKQIADLDSELKRLDAVIATQNTVLAGRRERLETLKKELTAGNHERQALYGDKDPDEEERRLNEAVSNGEQAEKQTGERHNELQQTWNTAKAQVESLRKRIDRRQPELDRSADEFSEALEAQGFSNEEAFLKARLPAERRDELAAKAKELDERQTNLKARQKDRETRLADETARNVTDQTLEALEPQFRAYEESLKDLRDSIAGLKHKLSENTGAKERIKEKQTAIDAQKKECRRWDNLHELIGSADGKKYRNFAQGLTFQVMIGHANRQLRKMTDRYLLVRDDVQPLALNVMDNYQAGEIRSTKNLSGGESFIVSLSLALGLSQMASRNVRVDSLFLDEGFGTLDEEALDTALETLASLQQNGKLVGVISHVPALKERISTQIRVTPQNGGNSRIDGPGCGSIGAAG